ncbi:MAG: 1,4-dihydroxy-2-naphthoyl-CoA synthase, partial [Cyanobacteriota bacterium]
MAATPSAEPGIAWQPQGSYSDILFDLSDAGIARITINRPHKRNAFRPQ